MNLQVSTAEARPRTLIQDTARPRTRIQDRARQDTVIEPNKTLLQMALGLFCKMKNEIWWGGGRVEEVKWLGGGGKGEGDQGR